MYSFSLKPACLSVARAFRVWRLARCLSRPGVGGNGVPLYAGAALGLLLVCQINAPSLQRAEAMPCREMAGLAACVVMGPKPVKTGVGKNQGFTLIELAVVLVVIGLVVGGVLVGQDLINAANVRSQLSQIEKYNAAVNTFENEYGGLPGDLPDPGASAFGFGARGTVEGQGDGNGFLEGSNQNVGGGCIVGGGETLAFWQDLSHAQLIAEGISTYSGAETLGTSATPQTISLFMPVAKIGQGNYVYAWSDKNFNAVSCSANYSHGGHNFFGIFAAQDIYAGFGPYGVPGLTVRQAYMIDSKIDDGMPQTGNVGAFVSGYASPPIVFNTTGWSPNTTTSGGTATSCYDTTTGQYSISQNNGTGVNCVLSFKFQ